MEINRRDEVGHVAVAAGRVLDPLDLRIDRFALGVRHPVLQVRQDVLQAPPEHLGHLHHRFQAGANRPGMPALEELPRRLLPAVFEQQHSRFLERPRTGRLQIGVAQRLKLLGGERRAIAQPGVFRPHQLPVLSSKKLFVLPPAHQIHGLPKMRRHMELVEDDLLGVFEVLHRGGQVRIPHVHRHREDPLQLLGGEGLPEGVQALLLPLRRHVQNPAALQVVDHSYVLVPLLERLLVHPQVGQRFCLATRHPPPHGALHDVVELVPRHPEQTPHLLLTGRPKPADRQPLEERREAASRFRPRQLHHARTVFRTVAARRGRMDDRPVLARVQVPPLPLRLVVVQRAQPAALRAGPAKVGRVAEDDMHLSDLQFQFDSLHTPRGGDPENPGVQFAILHRRPSAARSGGRTTFTSASAGIILQMEKSDKSNRDDHVETEINPLNSQKSP